MPLRATGRWSGKKSASPATDVARRDWFSLKSPLPPPIDRISVVGPFPFQQKAVAFASTPPVNRNHGRECYRRSLGLGLVQGPEVIERDLEQQQTTGNQRHAAHDENDQIDFA